jgi:hypothetical protein
LALLVDCNVSVVDFLFLSSPNQVIFLVRNDTHDFTEQAVGP